MSAIGTKRTSASAPHMSAFGGKADMDWIMPASYPPVIRGANARICIGLSTVVNRQRGRHAATRWKRTAGEGPASCD